MRLESRAAVHLDDASYSYHFGMSMPWDKPVPRIDWRIRRRTNRVDRRNTRPVNRRFRGVLWNNPRQ
jgi:hypothetical protein